jgi:uncharacterized protein (TIGR02246 family)
MTSLLLALAIASPLAAADVRAAIEAANRAFEAAVAKGDARAAAALYTASGQALPAGSDVVSGTEAIEKLWQGVFASGVKGIRLQTLEVESHSDVAHEVGSYELLDASGKTLDRGKYVVIWKKEGGRFKLHRDIWTTSVPPARGAP